jgi:hypothetical protein
MKLAMVPAARVDPPPMYAILIRATMGESSPNQAIWDRIGPSYDREAAIFSPDSSDLATNGHAHVRA